MISYSRPPLRSEHGIAIFSADDFYWHTDIRRDQLREYRELLETMPALEAARVAGIPGHYVAAYQRSDFIYFLPYRPGGDFTVLDLGSGFGSVTLPLARQMPDATIHAVDGSLDILSVLARRAAQEGCSNIQCAKVGVFEQGNLPFAEKSFDLIILNGVLEWIGAGVTTGEPRDHQVRFLQYIRTLLKDTGVLYIGIEGRLFPGYLMGIRDPHSGLRYTSVVPRRVANWICRRQGKPEGYRTYTYTERGYRQLFREAGFALTDLTTVYPVASYKDPFFLFQYNNPAAYRFAFTTLASKLFPTWRGRMLFRWLYRFGIEKIFAPSYLFLLGSGRTPRLIDHHLAPLLSGTIEPLKVLGNLANAGQVSFLIFDQSSSRWPRWVYKTNRFDPRPAPPWEALGALRCPEFVLPERVTATGELFPYIAAPAPGLSRRALRRALRFIRAIHHRTETKIETCAGVPTGIGFCHGDFTLENILWSAAGPRLIDFDDCQVSGPQIFDACSAILHFHRFGRHLGGQRLVEQLCTPDTLSLFHDYDERLSLERLQPLWHAFFLDRALREHATPARAAVYAELASLVRKTGTSE